MAGAEAGQDESKKDDDNLPRLRLPPRQVHKDYLKYKTNNNIINIFTLKNKSFTGIFRSLFGNN
jgi:hypothetical protein